ncbi:cyclase family protein [Wielerella bovis]|uniref:cyclase family protein n=1 Tax=Wielerella bovis TaxID=2917790 RepID=UPI002018AD8E|nr:cyclase family protein [Wielerella bovis]ULJ61909.1 cyclase family protein [Wielerella bovis]
MNISEITQFLKTQNWLDLSHEINADTPHFSAFSPLKSRVLFTVEKDGFFTHEYTLVSQYGTHIDAPIHFAPNTRALHEIQAHEWFYPLFVIHKEQAVQDNPDYRLTVEDILAFEQEYGRISEGSFVAFASGWSARWHDKKAFYNHDENGQAHTPGWDLDALKFLHEQRNVAVIGHETLDTDSAEDCRLHGDLRGERYWLSQNKFQIEVLNRLPELPAVGAAVWIGAPNIQHASGFNARVVAVYPIVDSI